MKLLRTATLFLLAACLHSALWAQVSPAPAAPFQWAPDALESVRPMFATEDAVYLFDKRYHAYVPSGESLDILVHQHKRVRILTEIGVEMYNKMYVPIPYDGKVELIEARVITPGGKVVPLPANKILDTEEEGRAYKKFALEGVEKGCDVELITRVRKPLGFFGLEVFQGERTPTQEASFTLEVPGHLAFDLKGFNGMEEAPVLEGEDTRRTIATGSNLPVLENEKYAAIGPHLAHVQYKLSYNLSNENSPRMFTWNQLAKNAYSGHNEFSDKEKKAVASFLKSIKMPALKTPADKIIWLENYIKNNFSISEEAISEEAGEIEYIAKKNVADFSGITRFFAACFQQMGIAYFTVYPNRRDKIQFDEDLENYRLIDNALFYFPELKTYMEPTDLSFRYPLVHFYHAGTRGLVVRTASLGGLGAPYAAFDTIPIGSYTETLHNLDATVQLNATLDSVLVKAKHTFSGYAAAAYRPVFHFLPAEQRNEVVEEVLRSSAPEGRVISKKTTNTAMEDGATNKPLLLEGELMTAELLEQGGGRLLLNVGVVLGPQVEMYQEKERVLPIMIEYPHILERHIDIVIPNGYAVKNADELNMRITGSESGEDDMGFVSTYKQEGNTLKVHIYEYYKSLHYPKARLNNFKSVINAAADFNKIVLVLEKK